jgi:hypothetical protein
MSPFCSRMAFRAATTRLLLVTGWFVGEHDLVAQSDAMGAVAIAH